MGPGQKGAGWKMDIGAVNHEVDFLKAYDLATKEKVEKVLLKHRISYFIEWEDRRLGGLFRKPGNHCTCMFRIHSDEVPRAKQLLTEELDLKAKGTQMSETADDGKNNSASHEA